MLINSLPMKNKCHFYEDNLNFKLKVNLNVSLHSPVYELDLAASSAPYTPVPKSPGPASLLSNP